MKFSVLASGSAGNCLYVEVGDQCFLVDAGLTGKKTLELFEKIGRNPNNLSGIFISHEHGDHVKGAGVLARKYGIPIYANHKTWEGMGPSVIGEVSSDLKFDFEAGTVKTFTDLDVESFAVSHDSRQAQFYVFHANGKKLTIVTDTGYINSRMKGVMENSDVFIFESNHDVSMLRMGKYPWSLQRRILGDCGHLSNEDAGYALAEVIGNRTKRVYLAHLSQENNLKDLARMTVEQVLQEAGSPVGEQYLLLDTDPDEPTVLATV